MCLVSLSKEHIDDDDLILPSRRIPVVHPSTTTKTYTTASTTYQRPPPSPRPASSTYLNPTPSRPTSATYYNPQRSSYVDGPPSPRPSQYVSGPAQSQPQLTTQPQRTSLPRIIHAHPRTPSPSRPQAPSRTSADRVSFVRIEHSDSPRRSRGSMRSVAQPPMPMPLPTPTSTQPAMLGRLDSHRSMRRTPAPGHGRHGSRTTMEEVVMVERSSRQSLAPEVGLGEGTRQSLLLEEAPRRNRSINFESDPRLSGRLAERQRMMVDEDGRRREFYVTPR